MILFVNGEPMHRMPNESSCHRRCARIKEMGGGGVRKITAKNVDENTRAERESSDWLVGCHHSTKTFGFWKEKGKPRASSTTESVEAQRMAIFT